MTYEDDEEPNPEGDEELGEGGDEGESSFCVRVVDNEGEPVPNIKVMLSFTAWLRGVTDTVRTDEDGRAEFDGYRDGEAKVFVDGDFIDTYEFADGEEITVTL